LSTIWLVRGPADPVDGVADYCTCLAQALSERGHQVTVTAVDWKRGGWLNAIRDLLWQPAVAAPDWTLLQHTHLSWSRRGFPLFTVLIALALRRRTIRLAGVIHDPLPFGGARQRDKVRRSTQVTVMRWLVRSCDLTLVTVPRGLIPWLRHPGGRIEYLPVGSNIHCLPGKAREEPEMFEVVVFGVSLPHSRELLDIARIARLLLDAIGPFRLSVLGRGSHEATAMLRELLDPGLDVELETTGVLSEAELCFRLGRADAALFVRAGGISSRRGTALAALAAGLPVVGFAGPETAPPLSEAGVILACPGDAEAAAAALAQLARDPRLAQSLRARSVSAYDAHFAWPVIAEHLERALRLTRRETVDPVNAPVTDPMSSVVP
jgi:glycosyltransferase involved in cell wall biosynthesis